jgi:hypothetical protein
MLVTRQAQHLGRWKVTSTMLHLHKNKATQDLDEYIRGAHRRMMKVFALAGGLWLLLTSLLLGIAKLTR